MTASLSVTADVMGGGDPSTLWRNMTLGGWWRLLAAHGFRLERSRWWEATSVTASCAANSLLGLAQKALHGDAVRAAPLRYDPVFVLGHWRAGATYLHALLALDERFGFPRFAECCAPQHCLVTERLFPRHLSRRLHAAPVLDGAVADLESPQEDELALLAMGAPTPMWSLAYPGESRGHAYLTLQEISLCERERWEGILWQFVRLLTYRNPGRRLVLKSPSHTARLALLARMFPQARFVHIVRDPYVVFQQTVRMWRTLQAGSALLRESRFDLQTHVLTTLRNMYAGFESARAALPPERFHQVHYEQLVREPLPTLARCYEALELPDFARVQPCIQARLAPHVAQGFVDDPVSDDSRIEIARVWGPIFRDWGYNL